MKIVFYCQHVLGLGHFFRSLELCRALAGHEILFVTGGESVAVSFPPHVKVVKLPGLMMDADFTALHATDPEKSVAAVKAERQRLLLDLFREERPDLFLVELYPFGRKAFRFELDPVFEGIRSGDLPACRVVCSLRDILVEKSDVVKYETRVVKALSSSFDALLVHADPALLTLDETFSRMGEIEIPVAYTGFVTPRPAPGARQRIRNLLSIGEDERLIVASAGGGTVGEPLLSAVAGAFGRLDPGTKVHLQIFAGPYMAEEAYGRLLDRCGEDSGIRISRFTDDFLSFLAAADLSVSMAGYNTCMNILAADVPALVWPFSQNREQRMRALELAGRGRMTVLEDTMLSEDRLAAEVARALGRERRGACDIDLSGAKSSAEWLENWMKD